MRLLAGFFFVLGIGFGQDLANRPTRLALVIDRSAEDQANCQSIREAALALAGRFEEGKDEVALVTFSHSARIDMPFTNRFKTTLGEQLGQLECRGLSNPSAGAQEAIAALAAADSASQTLVVMITRAGPKVLEAEWPVRRLSDQRYGMPKGPAGCTNPARECAMPVATCRPAPDWVSAKLFYAGFGAAVVPDALEEIPARFDLAGMSDGCVFQAGETMPLPTGNRDIAYIPEADAAGISFAGPFPLTRFTSGPYKGKIRPDVRANFTNAAYAHLVNVLAMAHPEPHSSVRVELLVRAGAGQTTELAHALGDQARVTGFESYKNLPNLVNGVTARLAAFNRVTELREIARADASGSR